MELLRTKGIWLHSVRLALQQAASPSFDQTVSNRSGHITRDTVNAANGVAEKVFAQFVESGGDLKGRCCVI
jgi:hypothetical protein